MYSGSKRAKGIVLKCFKKYVVLLHDLCLPAFLCPLQGPATGRGDKISPSKESLGNKRKTNAHFILTPSRLAQLHAHTRPIFTAGVYIANPPLISTPKVDVPKRKTQVGSSVFVGTSGLQKRAFHGGHNQSNGCICVMNAQKCWYSLRAESDQGSCKFHLHEFFEQFPREGKRGEL